MCVRGHADVEEEKESAAVKTEPDQKEEPMAAVARSLPPLLLPRSGVSPVHRPSFLPHRLPTAEEKRDLSRAAP